MTEKKGEKLSQKEQARREELEKVIDEAWEMQWQAAEALAEVEAKRLYRSSHATFRAYVDDRFSKCRQWAYDRIAWFKVNTAAGTTEEDKRLSVSAARKMKAIADDPNSVKKTVKTAQKNAQGRGKDTPTADDVQQAKRHVASAARKQSQSNEDAAEPERTEYRLQIWASQRNEVLTMVQELRAGDPEGVRITKKGSGSDAIEVTVLKLRTLYSWLAKLHEQQDEFDLSVQGQRKVVNEKRRQQSRQRRKSGEDAA